MTLAPVALPLLIVPAALLVAESVVAHSLYVDRYVLYGEAGAALLAGAGAARAGRWLTGLCPARPAGPGHGLRGPGHPQNSRSPRRTGAGLDQVSRVSEQRGGWRAGRWEWRSSRAR